MNVLNATTPTLSYVAAQADSGAQFDCVVNYPAYTGIANTLTSSAATLTVQAGAVVNNKLKEEMWLALTRGAVESGAAGNPATVGEFTSFHAPVNVLTPGGADFTYARRVSGLFIPAVSGNYVFFVCSDDDSDLFLSTDESPSHKRLIAQETVWSDDMSWSGAVGAPSDVNQKRSDKWSPDGGVTMPYSTGIPLVALNRYYIEGVQHEGGGGDNFSATFKLLADADPADGTATALTNGVIAYLTSPVTTGSIATQPQSVTVYESQSFSLSVGVQTDSELSEILLRAFILRRCEHSWSTGESGDLYRIDCCDD